MTIPEKSKIIGHDGVVQKSDSNSVTVKIISESACSACHAEGICSLSGREEKIVEVSGYYNVAPGDNVTVLMKQSNGFRAVLLGYVLPLILLISVMIILASFSDSELITGTGAIASLIPYYLIIWLFRKRISKKFSFTIKPD
jgi:sigma-E factor negative regulatory protein RseC